MRVVVRSKAPSWRASSVADMTVVALGFELWNIVVNSTREALAPLQLGEAEEHLFSRLW